MKTLTLPALVEALHRLDEAEIGTERVLGILGEGALDEASLRPFVGFRAEGYARRLVHRSELFDVMVLSWLPGQVTPVHNHAGQLGWVRLVRGAIREDRFRYPGGAATADPATVEIDADGRGSGVVLEACGTALVDRVGAVATVDRVRAIHRLGNPADAGEGALTLHVYSRPHDSCLCFDPDQGTCWRRELRFVGS